MMKIAIDTGSLQKGHAARGIGVYTRNLIEGLRKLNNKDFIVESIDFSSRNYPLTINHYQLIHYPYFDFFFNSLLLVKKTKTIVTIHDCIPLVFPEKYPPGIKGKIRFLIQKHSLQAVDRVITDSQNSKKDIVKYLNYPEEKISVIYLAPSLDLEPINPAFLDRVKKKYHLPEKFVLYVGDVNWNKNVVGLADICHEIGIPLVIAGKNALLTEFDKNHIENQPLVKLLEKYQDDLSVLRLGFVENRELKAIYKLASVYCQPSFYEGFGISLLDAMLYGCPVVCSRTSSLPEVGQNAAIYFDPKDETEFKEALQSVLRNDKIASELRNKGFLQVKNFSWEKTAKETVSVYKKVFENVL